VSRALSLLVPMMLAVATPAVAQTFVLVCEPTDNPQFSPESYVVDEQARTVRHQSTLVRSYAFTVPAGITPEQISWRHGNTLWTLDRYSGVLSKQIPEGVTNWRCRKAERAI
jgi:hypothetical protein